MVNSIHMSRRLKKKYTLTLEESLVDSARQSTDNLSETVCELLRQFVSQQESERIHNSLVEYENSSEERRRRLGVFSHSKRKFL